MIRKLMKYDLKKMLRVLIYIYIVSISLSIITRLINIGKEIQVIFIIGQVFAGLTYSALCSILVNTFVHILLVFYKNFYKDESYLTHTLPVSKNKLFLSKYLSSLIVILSSVIVCIISLFIMFYSKSFMTSLKNFINISISGFNMPVGLFISLIILIIFSQICTMISMAFTAIVKANSYNSKRTIKGLSWFAIYYIGAMIITLLLAIIIFSITGNISLLFAKNLTQFAFLCLLFIALFAYISYAILFYLICKKLFNKCVNVD